MRKRLITILVASIIGVSCIACSNNSKNVDKSQKVNQEDVGKFKKNLKVGNLDLNVDTYSVGAIQSEVKAKDGHSLFLIKCTLKGNEDLNENKDTHFSIDDFRLICNKERIKPISRSKNSLTSFDSEHLGKGDKATISMIFEIPTQVDVDYLEFTNKMSNKKEVTGKIDLLH